jgi:hypothetical protein
MAGILALAAGCGGGGGGGSQPMPPPPLVITTTTLPGGTIGVPYNRTVMATGGTPPRTFSLLGTLPAGLTLMAATGVISGTPTGPAGTFGFAINVADSAVQQQSLSQALSITISVTSLGRNDSIATATPLGNGSFNASISPSGHPNTVFSPDQDFYRIETTAASTITVDIDSAGFGNGAIDPVIEIVNSSGTRLSTCALPGEVTFTSPCMHDDEDPGVLRDPLLRVQVGAGATIFVRVLDWRGDARPDAFYNIHISGVN